MLLLTNVFARFLWEDGTNDVGKKDLIFSWKKDDDHDDGLGVEAQTTMMVVIHVNETLSDLTSLSNVHIYLTEFV